MNWADRLEPWTNPLLLKELRQGLRSRGLAIGAMASLALCVGSYALFAVEASSENLPGRNLAAVVGFCLCVVTLAIIPNAMRTQLAQDFSSRTFELVRVAGLSSWRLATGLYLGGALRVVFTVALMAPFLVATVLGGGLVFEQIAVGLLLVLAAASLAVAGIVALGALAEGSPFGKLLGRALPFLPFIWLFVAGSMGLGLLSPYTQPNFGQLAGTFVTIGAVGTVFLLRLAADALAPEGIRTFLPTKLALLVAMGGFVAVLVWVDEGRGNDDAVMASVIGALPWLVGIVSTRAGLGSRAWPWVLRDGFGPSMVWAILLVAASGAAFSVSAGTLHPLRAALRLAMYFLEASAITRLLHALVDPRRSDSASFLVLWLLTAAALGTAGVFAAIFVSMHVTVPWAVMAMLPVSLTFGSYRDRIGWELYPLAVSAVLLVLARRREVSGVR